MLWRDSFISSSLTSAGGSGGRRSFHGHRGHGRSAKSRVAVVADCARHRDRNRLRARCVQSRGSIRSGYVARARSIAIGQPAVIGVAGVCLDCRGAAQCDSLRIGRARNLRRPRLFHLEAGGTGGATVLAAIAQVRGHLVRAGLQASRVNRGGSFRTSSFCCVATPAVFDCAVRIETGSVSPHGHRLTGKDFCRFH